MLPKPEAIFFDFDGVILDSADIKTEAFVELFNHYPQHIDRIKAYHLANAGISRFVKFEWIYSQILEKTLSASESTRLGADFSAIALKKILAAPFISGALELLENCKGMIPCFIASGTPEEELKFIVGERNIAIYFNEICGSPSTKAEIVNSLTDKYKLINSNCWFIGDASSDYEAAKQTSLNFIARTSHSMDSYWKQQQSILIVDSLIEVNKIWFDGD